MDHIDDQVLMGESQPDLSKIQEAIPLIIFNEEKRSKFNCLHPYRQILTTFNYYSVWNKWRRKIIPVRIERTNRYCCCGRHVPHRQELPTQQNASWQVWWIRCWTHHQPMHQGCLDVVTANGGTNSGWWAYSSGDHGHGRPRRPGRGFKSWCSNFLSCNSAIIVLHLQFGGIYWRKRITESEPCGKSDEAYLD